MNRLTCLFLVGLTLLVALAGCGDEITRTQLTVRIDAPDDLIVMTGSIRLIVRRGADGEASESYPVTTSTLWPMDLHIVPGGSNDADDLVDIAVEAIARDSTDVLVRQRRLIAFKRKDKLVLALRLERCGAMEYRSLCAEPPMCRGADCFTCVMGSCIATPTEMGMVWGEDADEHLPGIDGGPKLDAAPDANTDADADTGLDADADSDAGDADADAGDADAGDADADDADADTGPRDCGCEADHYMPDPIPEPVIDGGPVPMPVDCTAEASWVSTSQSLPIPAAAIPYSRVQIPIGGDFYNQYVCRTMSEFGNVAGKVNATTNGASSVAFDYGCWHAVPGTPAWLSKPEDTTGKVFEVLAPVQGCLLEWQDSSAAGLPAKAVVTGRDNLDAPIYSCLVDVMAPESNGAHIGRVSAVPGDVCTTQFFGGVRTAAPPFKVLVQKLPQ